MCDTCVTAEKELATFLNELEEKYPGTTIGDTPVTRGHHVFVAVYVQAEKRAEREVLDSLKLQVRNNPDALLRMPTISENN